MEPHAAVVQFRKEKIEEIEQRLAGGCECRGVPHTYGEIHLSPEVCEYADGDAAVRSWDGMAYMLEDLHDTIWPEHTCFDPMTN
jgi:hypothetical protein